MRFDTLPGAMQLTSTMLSSLALVALASSAHHQAEEQPPLTLSLELDGARYEAVDGAEFSVNVGGRELRARVKVGRTRRFDEVGVRFDYPQHMLLEADEHEDDSTLWWIDGWDCTIFVMRSASDDAEAALSDLITGMIASMSEATVALQPWQTIAGGVERAGLQARFPLDEQDIEVALMGFSVPVGDEVVLFTLQDFPDDGEAEEEGPSILALIASTFEVLDRR